MSQHQLPIILVTAVALLSAGSYAYYQAQAQQAATLARIAALDICLATSNQQRTRAAKNTVLGISEVVRKNHSPASDVAVLRQAQQIQDSTQTLLARLHQLRQSWQTLDSKAEISTLSAQVDRYVCFVRQFAPETPPLTLPTAQTAATGWLGEFAIKAEPKPAALAMLTKLETQLRQMAAEALAKQATKIGARDYFDKIGAFVIPASETVAPDAIYQAQLVLVQASTSGHLYFSADGQNLPINPVTGKGLVRFNVPAARLGQPDTVRAQWHGRVQIHWSDADTVLETTVPYFIIRPHSR